MLAFNLNSIMKRLALGEDWRGRRLKNIRFNIVNLPGRVINHARTLLIRLNAEHPSHQLLLRIRQRLLALANAPPTPA